MNQSQRNFFVMVLLSAEFQVSSKCVSKHSKDMREIHLDRELKR
jgi:hypothetical protein